MALISTFTPVVAGTPPTPAAAANGDTAPVGAGLVLVVINTGTQKIVTVTVPGLLATGDAYPDKAYTVAATTGVAWIPLLKEYADPTDGLAHIAYDSLTGVTRYVVRYG